MVTLQNDNVKEVRTRAECLLEKSMFRLQKVRIYKDLARLDIKQGELQYAKVRLNYVAEYGNTFLQPKRQGVF